MTIYTHIYLYIWHIHIYTYTCVYICVHIYLYIYVITSKYKYTSLLKYELLRRNRQYVWESHGKMKSTFCNILHL